MRVKGCVLSGVMKDGSARVGLGVRTAQRLYQVIRNISLLTMGMTRGVYTDDGPKGKREREEGVGQA